MSYVLQHTLYLNYLNFTKKDIFSFYNSMISIKLKTSYSFVIKAINSIKKLKKKCSEILLKNIY